jgi:uncharacterized protein (TIGR02001 family)
MTFKFKVAAVALAISAVSAAHAQKAPQPDYTTSIGLNVLSQYRFRGMEQTSGAPATQFTFDFAHKNGVYLGAFTSNVSWIKDVNGASAGNLEVDLYGGYKTEIAKDLVLDVGAIQYWYPGNDSGKSTTLGGTTYTNADTFEVYGGLTYGIYSFKYSRSLGNFLGNKNSSGAEYVEAAINFDLSNGYSLIPHIGQQTVPGQSKRADYNDFSLTLSKELMKNMTLSIAYVTTSANQGGFYQTVPASNPSGVNRFLGSTAGVLGFKMVF